MRCLLKLGIKFPQHLAIICDSILIIIFKFQSGHPILNHEALLTILILQIILSHLLSSFILVQNPNPLGCHSSASAMERFQRPKGTRDFLPAEMALRKAVATRVRRTFESFGFQELQTPTFEDFALLAHRSGEEIRERMFTFAGKSGDSEYALRPEVTAAICRLEAEEPLLPKPHRFYYLGPCYRYDQPQKGRYREFWQAGVELLGPRNLAADAETIAVAMGVMADLGLSDAKLKVGHIGIVRALLESAELAPAEQNTVIADLDRLLSIQEKCELLASREELEANDGEYIKRKVAELAAVQIRNGYRGAAFVESTEIHSDDAARAWLGSLPHDLLNTQRWLWEQRGLPVELVERLAAILQLRGSPADIARKADELLGETPASEAWAELRGLTEWLARYGLTDYELVLGVARGLDYYTRTVFEIDHPSLGAEKQVCGGGRYDELVREFGGPELPAVGFAFGFDRLCLLVEQDEQALEALALDRPRLDCFVAHIQKKLLSQATELVTELRGRDLRAECELQNRDLRGQLGYADSTDAPWAIIIGPRDLAKEPPEITLRDMSSQEQEQWPLEGVVEEVVKRIEADSA